MDERWEYLGVFGSAILKGSLNLFGNVKELLTGKSLVATKG